MTMTTPRFPLSGEWQAPQLSRTVRALLTFGRVDVLEVKQKQIPGGRDAVATHQSAGVSEKAAPLKADMARVMTCPPERWGINE